MVDTSQPRPAKTRWSLPHPLQRLRMRLLRTFWYIYPDVTLVLQARPLLILETLLKAAKPSTERLHLREVFRQGRRYHLQPMPNGFVMSTTSKVQWHYRRRTVSSSLLDGELVVIDQDTTRLTMRAHFRLAYLLSSLLIPLYVTSILIWMPWPRLVIISLLIGVYLLSWLGHRYNAALEAHEMIYFVTKALEDYVPKMSGVLAAGETVVYNPDFAEAWENFYHQKEQP